ncbi:protein DETOXIFICATION 9 isoform X3 [Vigna angularis]|uniref:protein DETOXIFICATION 9 isoform X3 n=1 Tax=Phaseolus angularis TaxID=3914 RepID=UPI0022B5D684|nr:protein DETOXIFICATION 9 isoform X3 [Vigna angularis]
MRFSFICLMNVLVCIEMMDKEESTVLITKSEVAEDAFWVELKRVWSMAAPMVAATASQNLLEVVSLMMVGHLGILVSFSGVAIATSFAEVTGFCVILGMAGALETLCGQTYGAEEFGEIGKYTCCAIVTLLLIRYFQTQSIIFPMLFSSIAVLCLHIPICWGLVFKLGLGHVGAAYATAISYWLNVIGLGIYMKYSLACQNTKVVFSFNALLSIPEFCQFAVPSGLMFCFEMWSFELLTLVAGLLPNPQLQTSVLSICLNTTTLHYIIPYAVGASASTRISNELGAGNPNAAQCIVRVVVILAIVDGVIVSTFFFCFRHILGYVYTNEEEVVYYVEDIVPILCGSFAADSLVGALSGVARGGGFQQIGAYVNLGAYYLVGIPLAFLLGFVLHFNSKGLWMGSLTGSLLQVIILAGVTVTTDWQKEATKARQRIFEKSNEAHSGLV